MNYRVMRTEKRKRIGKVKLWSGEQAWLLGVGAL